MTSYPKFFAKAPIYCTQNILKASLFKKLSTACIDLYTIDQGIIKMTFALSSNTFFSCLTIEAWIKK